MLKKVAVFLLALNILALSAYAAEPSSWKSEKGYGEKVAAKVEFALSNLLFGWTEFFSEPYEAVKEKQNVLKSIPVGLWNGLGDTLGGALHLVTFPCTYVDVPLPEGGVKL